MTVYNENISREIFLQISEEAAHLNLLPDVLWSFMLKQISTASAAFLPVCGRNSRVASVSSSAAVHSLKFYLYRWPRDRLMLPLLASMLSCM